MDERRENRSFSFTYFLLSITQNSHNRFYRLIDLIKKSPQRLLFYLNVLHTKRKKKRYGQILIIVYVISIGNEYENWHRLEIIHITGGHAQPVRAIRR